jgi:hypothetical protein
VEKSFKWVFFDDAEEEVDVQKSSSKWPSFDGLNGDSDE